MPVTIEIAYALPDKQQCVTLTVENGTSARQAILQALDGGLIVLSEADRQKSPEHLPIGVYGQTVDDDYRVQADDRLEIYRPLLQDPKERRRKIARQNAS